MVSTRFEQNRINPKLVMVIILQIALITFIGCGQSDNNEAEYVLPESFTHLPKGKAIAITPMSFIDTLNNGAMGEVYYFGNTQAEDPKDVVVVPGMISLSLNDVSLILDTLRTSEPVFLLSLYGSDARKMAQVYAPKGITFYYVVGGGYKIAQLMRQQRLEFLPRPQMKHRKK